MNEFCCLEGFCTNRCDLKIRNWNENIQVSEDGMIWRIKAGSLNRIQPYLNRGILYVDLFKDGGQLRFGEVMLRSFGNLGSGRITYGDGDPKNCKLTNIRWSK